MSQPDIDATLIAASALRSSESWRAVGRQLSDRTLVRVHRGWYVARADEERLNAEHRHLLRVYAVARKSSSTNAVYSHTSAAALWGLPVLRFDADLVHTTLRHGIEVHRGRTVVRHRDTLPEADVTERGGLLCTSLERTVVDVARMSSIETALAVADGAFRLTAWDDARLAYDLERAEDFRQAIASRVARMAGRRGIRQARRVIELADGRAQLPGESVSRLRLVELGLRDIRLQVPVPAPSGRDYFVDFGLDDIGVWGEFDGMAKYADPTLRRGRSPEQVLIGEKEREDWIRATTGRPVVRWGFRDIESTASLRRVFARHGVRVAGPAR